MDPDRGTGGWRVLGDVGHRLLHDAVAGDGAGRLDHGQRPGDVGLHRDAGRPVVGQQLVEVLERGRRPDSVGRLAGPVGAQHADGAPHLVEALATHPLGVGEGGVGLVGVTAQQMPGRRQLQHHDREGVAEHVVDVPSDALALAERRPVGDESVGAGELVTGEAKPIAELTEPPAEREPHHPVRPSPFDVARGSR